MKTLMQTFNVNWIDVIGWTLLHSLWQASVVCFLVMMLLRLMPTLHSSIRYAIAGGGLLLTAAISAVTLIRLAEKSPVAETSTTGAIMRHALYFPEAATEQTALIPDIVSFLEHNMSLIVLLWAIGFLFFAMRWSIGLYHSYRLRSGAQLIDGFWLDYVQRKAQALDIRRSVKIAESIAISAPMVLGYLKPLILLPVGMISGLSTQQLETILLHELAHIRRNDYLMNFLQTIIESIFFFNPFVRMLSNEVRREREYCCDDIVVGMHGNSSAYVHALVRLAEARLGAPAFALPLTGDKNQLLGRIKRIMERSKTRPSVISRLLIPALLIGGALASISWISAGEDEQSNHVVLSKTDTLPDGKNSGKRAHFSRRSIITIDENGQPHEEVIQEFEGDEELRALLENNMSMLNDSAFANGFPGFDPGQLNGGMLPGWNDTIPPFDQKEWQKLADAFHQEFGERFEHLFQGHGDLPKLMEEFERDFQWEQWPTPFEGLLFDSLPNLRHDDVYKNFQEEFEKFRDFAPYGLEDLDKNFRSFNNPIQNYERALREQLVQDGYLSPDETIESLQWSEDSFKVNGKSLNREDVKKYNDLRKGILEEGASDIR